MIDFLNTLALFTILLIASGADSIVETIFNLL